MGARVSGADARQSTRQWWLRRIAVGALAVLFILTVGIAVVDLAVDDDSSTRVNASTAEAANPQKQALAPPPILPESPSIPISVWLLAGAAAIVLTSPGAVWALTNYGPAKGVSSDSDPDHRCRLRRRSGAGR
ncbi:hypothetical protein GOEFS_080_00090 [Gordonia effusa NBRC 100432]|uniref:Uncharacterized protein n=1 Tax=Gordonia effusa NBRC 100432 TaxID=1077974 RepID=H0R2J6_9ACTN|nr:hypothetical protein GOEFS_080_00090 [Gordonia effusa NBRC 100432]